MDGAVTPGAVTLVGVEVGADVLVASSGVLDAGLPPPRSS
jgi:hypothetical protein